MPSVVGLQVMGAAKGSAYGCFSTHMCAFPTWGCSQEYAMTPVLSNTTIALFCTFCNESLSMAVGIHLINRLLNLKKDT